MYTQFFGNFLISKNIISAKDLLDALDLIPTSTASFGLLAVHSGLMTADELQSIEAMQKTEGKTFDELVISTGYMTQDSVASLKAKNIPDYLVLSQILIDKGKISYSEIENLLLEYQTDNEVFDMEGSAEQRDEIFMNIMTYCSMCGSNFSSKSMNYLSLFFNNLMHYICEDFHVLAVKECHDYHVDHYIAQKITGGLEVLSSFDMNQATAVKMASLYAKEDFDDSDMPIVHASIEDYLNLHNGLFMVNASNESTSEYTLLPPETILDQDIDFDEHTYELPIVFSFGTIHFIFRITDSK